MRAFAQDSATKMTTIKNEVERIRVMLKAELPREDLETLNECEILGYLITLLKRTHQLNCDLLNILMA